jgi:hypothetical protein
MSEILCRFCHCGSDIGVLGGLGDLQQFSCPNSSQPQHFHGACAWYCSPEAAGRLAQNSSVSRDLAIRSNLARTMLVTCKVCRKAGASLQVRLCCCAKVEEEDLLQYIWTYPHTCAHTQCKNPSCDKRWHVPCARRLAMGAQPEAVFSAYSMVACAAHASE